MTRLLFSTKALFHAWRARNLSRRANWLLAASEAHAAELAMNLVAARTLTRAPLPSEDKDDETAPPAGCSYAGQVLLGSLVGAFIAGLWIWIAARASR